MRTNVFLGWVMVLAITVSAQTWEIEVADNGREFIDMTDRSLRLDGDGRPHLAYGKDHLYYMWRDDGGWQQETADASARVGRHAALCLDPSGCAHISYRDDRSVALKYAFRSPTGWRVAVVDTDGDVGEYTSIGVDSAGHAHISYWDRTNGALKYAYEGAFGWRVETVDNEDGVGECTSLAIDSFGYPHISYSDYGAGYGHPDVVLKYARKDASGWRLETLDEEGQAGWYTSLALDSSGHPHVSYCARSDPNPALKYAYEDEAGWHIQTVESMPRVGSYSSLTLDATDHAHISYVGDYALRYAHEDVTGWHVETVDDEGNTGFFTSIALDSAGHPHISYADRYNDDPDCDLKYAYADGAGWHVEEVDTQGSVGLFTSLALDVQGYPHISYYDYYPNFDLKYAYQDQTGWHWETVDSEGDVGWATSLALDASGNPHITYCTGTAGISHSLRYAHRDGAAWLIEEVDTQGSVTPYTSLAVDAVGWPHLTYSLRVGYSLHYAHLDPLGWHAEVVDGQMDGRSSLRLDSGGNPHIVYSRGNMRYAHRDSSGWEVEVVTIQSGSGSLVLDALGEPHVGLGGYYCYRDATGWHKETVDGGGGSWPSLALDAEGHPHMSYCSGPYYRQSLKYAHRSGAGWHLQTVDIEPVGSMGRYSSLALDSSNCAHISYLGNLTQRYFGNYDLKFARLTSAGSESPTARAGTIRLVSVSPNPFRASTELMWELTSPGMVEAAVFDLLGRKVAVVAEGQAEQGEQHLTWRPVGLRSGVYVLRVSVEGTTAAVQPLIYRR